MLSLRTPEERVAQDHPLRAVKAILLMALHSVRSERLFCEQLDYNLLYRWFLNMDVDEPSFDHSTFSFNRERLLEHDVAKQFFAVVVKQATDRGLTSDEHFSADGTLIEAWASLKSFRPKEERPEDREPPDDPRKPTVDFHGEKRSNATHESTTDPEARLARKSNGQTAKLSYSLNGLTENENGLLVAMSLEQATGTGGGHALRARPHQAHHPGRGQGLRHEGLHRQLPCAHGHAACRVGAAYNLLRIAKLQAA